jgi:cytochrome c oxidase assembly protein subunit 15
LLTIGLVVAAQMREQRRWHRRLAWMALALVVFQGVLGGLRVVLDARTLALIHGCVGPVFFVFIVGLAATSSPWWFRQGPGSKRNSAGTCETLRHTAWFMLALGYCQLVVGANLRHIGDAADPMWYRGLVLTHVAIAIGIAAGAAVQLVQAHGVAWRGLAIRRWAMAFAVLVGVQIGLGIATWVVRFGWPEILGDHAWGARMVVAEKSFAQMNVITAHGAVGSLILAAETVVALRTARVLQAKPPNAER